MIEKKEIKHETKARDDGVELENQFILRLPEDVATQLHEALQTGNLKDRMTIKMDSDLRYGEVRFDHNFLYAKIVDLPTLIECLKTIDRKSFYKSADICQIMICKTEPDALDPEKESPNKGKKKDPNKVDKKYLWPHGITPPCKNVRKRRFRKTLKKKNVEAPEIEKEVKRLLRIDNDAVKVDFEIINEDETERPTGMDEDDELKEFNVGDDYNDESMTDGNKTNLNDSQSQKDINVESDDDNMRSGSAQHGGVGEHDIFGEEVSSSDDDDVDEQQRQNARMRDLEDTSRLSADDTRMSDFSMGAGGDTSTAAVGAGRADDTSNSQRGNQQSSNTFSKSMFGNSKLDMDENSSKMDGSMDYYDMRSGKSNAYDDDDSTNDAPNLSVAQINAKISEFRRQLADLKLQQEQKSLEIASIQNPTLKQRMHEALDILLSEIIEKELEMKDYENMLETQ